MELIHPGIWQLEKQNEEHFREIVGDAISDGMISWLNSIGYFIQAAAKDHHSNYPGGLFEHSAEMTKQLCKLTSELKLEWERPESPIIVGMLHDVCKCDLYNIIVDTESKYGYKIEYNNDRLLNGHGEVSVMMVQQYIAQSHEMVLTEEEMYCIRYHMGAFTDSKEWQFYSRAVHKYPNVLYTHTADMIASQIMEI